MAELADAADSKSVGRKPVRVQVPLPAPLHASWGVVVLAVAVVLAMVPPWRAAVTAAPMLAESIGIDLPRPFGRSVTVRPATPAGLSGDLYDPGLPAPALIVVPGGARQGKDDPRVIRVARSLAEAGRLVFVPQLRLRDRRFAWSDVEGLVATVLELARSPRALGVGVAGFSYGGSLALVAAEDPRIAEMLDFVATFGSYYELLGVLQGVTTGATTIGRMVIPWETVPEAEEILVDAAIGLAPPEDRPPLRAALAGGDPAGLSAGAGAVYDLIRNGDPHRTEELAGRLSASFRATLSRFSPATRIHRLRAPLLLMQAIHDPATPPTEALRLHWSVPGSRLIMLRTFLHVDPPAAGTPAVQIVADVWGAWRFTSWVLAAQE
jgi:pimeloyl-ACP methyl ester carboxylesterase